MLARLITITCSNSQKETKGTPPTPTPICVSPTHTVLLLLEGSAGHALLRCTVEGADKTKTPLEVALRREPPAVDESACLEASGEQSSEHDAQLAAGLAAALVPPALDDKSPTRSQISSCRSPLQGTLAVWVFCV